MPGVGFVGKDVEAEEIPDGALAQSGREPTEGNFCSMRIIVDKFLIKLFNNDKQLVRTKVKYYETQLNDIYKEADVSVNMFNNVWLPLKFKVVKLQFHDEEHCEREKNSPGRSQHCHFLIHLWLIEMFVAVGCKSWSDARAMLEAIATEDHSDVCLSYLFTSHAFNDKTLGMAFKEGICKVRIHYYFPSSKKAKNCFTRTQSRLWLRKYNEPFP